MYLAVLEPEGSLFHGLQPYLLCHNEDLEF